MVSLMTDNCTAFVRESTLGMCYLMYVSTEVSLVPQGSSAALYSYARISVFKTLYSVASSIVFSSSLPTLLGPLSFL